MKEHIQAYRQKATGSGWRPRACTWQNLTPRQRGRTVGTSCLASTQWLHTWQQHNLARDALLQNQWPGLRISRQLVRGLKLHLRQPGLGWMRMRARLTYTHCWTDCGFRPLGFNISSISWPPCLTSYQLLHGCNAAVLGTSCLASTQWLRRWQQHRVAGHA